MKIAVTSCADPIDQDRQPVWSCLAAAAPDHLVLLGDQIYMDYGGGLNPRLGVPACYPELEFAAHMYERYRRQWCLLKDSGLWQVPGMKVHGIWDDHDFAWNNSYGGPGPDPAVLRARGIRPEVHELPVPASKQRITRHLFRQYFSSLRAGSYPDNSLQTQQEIDQLSERLDRPVFFSESLPPDASEGLVCLEGNVRLLLTDGRSFRSSRYRQDGDRRLLGETQMAWLKRSIDPRALNIIASGCTLDKGIELTNHECWRAYNDYQELQDFLASSSHPCPPRVLFLSGDIHNTSLHDHHGPHLIEVVASGAARPWGNVIRPDRGNHVLIDVGLSALRIEQREGEPPGPSYARSSVVDSLAWRVIA